MKKLRLDIIIIGALVLAGAIFALVILLTQKPGGTVVVRVDGEVVAQYPLNVGRTEIINGVNGGTNKLVIAGGEAMVTEASCPDHLCVNMGKISKNGQSIICLPNKVVVEISGGEDDDVDAVAGAD